MNPSLGIFLLFLGLIEIQSKNVEVHIGEIKINIPNVLSDSPNKKIFTDKKSWKEKSSWTERNNHEKIKTSAEMWEGKQNFNKKVWSERRPDKTVSSIGKDINFRNKDENLKQKEAFSFWDQASTQIGDMANNISIVKTFKPHKEFEVKMVVLCCIGKFWGCNALSVLV